MKRLLPLACATALLALATPALAWKHTLRKWNPEDMPIRYEVADDGSQTTDCEETVPPGYCTEVSAEGFDAWHDAACAEFAVEYDGVAPNIGSTLDYRNRITFNDPTQVIEPGTWAVTYSPALGAAGVIDGVTYTHILDADIVFNDNATFVTGDVAAQGCAGAPFGPGASMEGVMTHEIGHFFGMGHPCEDPNKGGGPCTDPVLLDATMYYTVGNCDSTQDDINEDDIEGFTALYGPYATFSCSHQVTEEQAIGVVPFDLNCVINSEYLNEISSVEWNFGDGGSSAELNATHTYTDPGNYTIQVMVHGEREACGPEGWTNNFRRVGFVRACGVPEAAFEVTHVDGLKYQMLNDSDVSVYGCIADIQWQVYKGKGTGGAPIGDPIKAWEPIVEVPEEGEYTVVMNLGGIAGTGAAMATFEAKDTRGEGYGCSSTGSAAGGVGLLLIGALAVRRRR